MPMFCLLPLADMDSATSRIATQNRFGFSIEERDFISERFVEASRFAKNSVLDVGAAYGFNTLQALRAGASVIANDLDSAHLAKLQERAVAEHLSCLTLNLAKFPNETDFASGSLSAVLLRRVLHFLTPAEIELGIEKLALWLEPGGRVYVVTLSPNHHFFRSFKPEYDRRKQSGFDWPGETENAHQNLPVDIALHSPKYLHFMEPDILARAFEKKGFKIVDGMMFGYEKHLEEERSPQGYTGLIAQRI